MPESVKMPQSASPVAKFGAGDISERELTRERYNLHSTPPPRLRSHPRKQLFSPVSKFTASGGGSRAQAAVLRACLDQLARPAPKHKAVSMEDLTPNKRSKQTGKQLEVVAAGPRTAAEAAAAARVGRFMLLAAWRARRQDVRCLRRTLETQVSCSERLRIQVCTLKSLLDSDNAKVRLAMRELERLKQLARDKDVEKAVLEREKVALEKDVLAAEDRASEMSIGWRNSRNEADSTRAALVAERAAAQHLRERHQRVEAQVSTLQQEVSACALQLSAARAELRARAADAEAARAERARLAAVIDVEQRARECAAAECARLRAAGAAAEAVAARLRGELRAAAAELALATEQLAWWPPPLTRMMGVARSWFRHPMSLTDTVLWSLSTARHGC